ncbi:helix-turn-helix domain-containing protein [Amycolatopsis sp. cg5]|uniref:helix-turn-helix domain-containing protein n=1 Tax=Amycolatopsis sp. cg5 TaxID=3238802 RepID=UPI0035267B4E
MIVERGRGRGTVINQFGDILRRYRERRTLTQKELADKAGLSERTIRRWETGKHRNPQLMSVHRLADALSLGPAEHELLISAALSASAGREVRTGQARLSQTGTPPCLGR